MIGQLVLRHICPAIYAVMMDGLNPQVRSLFGKMRNNVWKVIEDSVEQGQCLLEKAISNSTLVVYNKNGEKISRAQILI